MAKVDYRKIKMTTIAIKEESIRGTYETLAAANTYCVQNAVLPTVTPNLLELDCSNGTMTPADNTVLVGDQEVTMSFDIAFPITDCVAATYVTNYGFILEACGLQTASAGDVAVTPDDNATTSLSMSYNIDGWEYRVRGIVGSELKLKTITKEAVFMNLSFIGTLEDRLEVTPLVATSAISFQPEMCGAITLVVTENSTPGTTYLTLCTSAVLTITNKIKPMLNVTATKGIAYHAIVERDSRLMLDCSTFWSGTDQKDDEMYGFFEASTKMKATLTTIAGEYLSIVGKFTAFDGKDSDGSLHHDIEIKHTGVVSGLSFSIFASA